MTSHLDDAVPVSTGFDHAFLTRACHLVGEEMRRLTGSRSSIASAATLRDVLLSILLSRGAPLLLVAAQAGHSPGVMLTHYGKWIPQPGATPAQPAAGAVSSSVPVSSRR
jgi:hypothetical protein